MDDMNKQTPLQRKVYNLELAVMITCLIAVIGLSWVVFNKPTIDDISRDVFDSVPIEKRDVFLNRANRLLTADPSLATDPDRWEYELTRLVMH